MLPAELTPDWVDYVVVELNLVGQDPGRELTTAELRQVIRTLRAKKSTDNAIALHLGGSHGSRRSWATRSGGLGDARRAAPHDADHRSNRPEAAPLH
jgi:hypothetical protein